MNSATGQGCKQNADGIPHNLSDFLRIHRRLFSRNVTRSESWCNDMSAGLRYLEVGWDAHVKIPPRTMGQ
jgi:hypothetical protein